MKNRNKTGWLLPTVLILFILEILSLPLILGLTYAGRAEAPDHTLVYYGDRLEWQTGTDVREDGSAVFSLFSDKYINVVSSDGEKVIAPGTEGGSTVRLRNDTTAAANWIATLYVIKSDERIPIVGDVDCDGTPTSRSALPAGLQATVIRSYTGKIGAKEIADFGVDWNWIFYEGDDQDQIDILLGNIAANFEPGTVEYGLYIVIDNGEILPPSPQTGDSSNLSWYIVLLIISAIVLIISAADRIRQRRKREKDE